MFAVLHFADFALHAVLRTAHAAPARPHALFAGTGKKSVLLAATATARAAGVEPGMTAPQAVARCPALVIHVPNATAEAEARAALLAVAFTLSPTIEDTAPGICTISLTGADPEKTLPAAHAAVATLADLALPASAGAQLDQQQQQLEHEQSLSALDAIKASETDIRQHGLAVQQQAFQQQAEQVAQQAAHQKEAALAQQQHAQQMAQQGAQAQNQAMQTGLEHATTMQQNDQQHQQALEQQAAAPQPTPTTGA